MYPRIVATTCHFATLGSYDSKLSCNDDNFIDGIQGVTSKYRGNVTGNILNS